MASLVVILITCTTLDVNHVTTNACIYVDLLSSVLRELKTNSETRTDYVCGCYLLSLSPNGFHIIMLHHIDWEDVE